MKIILNNLYQGPTKYDLKAEIIKQLRRDWPYLAGIAGLFLLGIWLGMRLPKISPLFAREFGNLVKERLTEIARAIQNAPFYVEIWVIWLNNLMASLTAVITGMFCPLFPLVFVIGNGMIIGLFQNLIQLKAGITANEFYLSLLPHGIFELPAFFIAAWVGIRFGAVTYKFIWRYIVGKEPKFFKGLIIRIAEYFETEARNYAILIAVMLVIAATIEVTVSPLLLKNTLK